MWNKFGIKLRNPRDPKFVKKIQMEYAQKRKKKICKEWLRERYEDKEMTMTEIAKEFGCNWRTIQRRCQHFGIKIRKKIIRPKFLKDKLLSDHTYSDIGNLKDVMVKFFGYKCMWKKCKYSKFIEIHHIEGNNIRNIKNARLHTKNHCSNAVLLCPNHHKEADFDLIDKQILKDIIQKKMIKEKVRHSK